MITIDEKISVSQDDPLAEQIESKLTEQDGWHMTETTTSKTYKRIQWIGMEKQNESIDRN